MASYIGEEKYKQIQILLSELKNKILLKARILWLTNKSQYLTQWTIGTMKNIGKIKSGEQAMPTNT